MATIKVLAVAGGGGTSTGQNNHPGGGGGGGVVYDPAYTQNAGSVSVSVGVGGSPTSKGGNSIFGSLTALGGGRGGDWNDGDMNGGCGGGGFGYYHGGGSGSQGGNGASGKFYISGGGGGAGGTPPDPNDGSGIGGNGGDGLSNSITGTAVLYGSGGSGSGGNGNGTTDGGTIGKGANASYNANTYGNDGIVIISYPTGSFTFTYSGTHTTGTDGAGNTYISMTTSGTLVLSGANTSSFFPFFNQYL